MLGAGFRHHFVDRQNVLIPLATVAVVLFGDLVLLVRRDLSCLEACLSRVKYVIGRINLLKENYDNKPLFNKGFT